MRDALSAESRDTARAQPAAHPRQQGSGRPGAGRRRADDRRHLTAEAAAFYDGLRRALDRFGVPFRENPRIVRGLDYYSHTAFEFVTDRLGAQGTVHGRRPL